MGVGGANIAGVTQEHHGYFGLLARVHTQHLLSSTNPVKMAIVSCRSFCRFFRFWKFRFFEFQIGFFKGIPAELRATALALKTAPSTYGITYPHIEGQWVVY
jgi:hypothetical protein